MTIRKVKSGWQVDIQPGGRGGRRIRKTFKTKAEARRFEAWAEHQAATDADWNPKRPDNRRLSDLVDAWYNLHGSQLRDGQRRYRKLHQVCERMGNPVARKLTAKDFTLYRSLRLQDGVTANTVNHEHAYLRSLFNELQRMGEWDDGNPIAGIRQIKLREQELAFLDLDQIRRLLETLQESRNKDVEKVTRLALATGARWSEAEKLTAERLHRDRVIYAETKSGRIRSVPIRPELSDYLKTRPTGRLYADCYAAFRGAVKRAGIQLPQGQMAHVLRHTFASHFMMNGGNLLTLQRILGHSDIRMTMRYAHLAPDHLEEARALNPIDWVGHKRQA
ncbi:tyrosine-type recombinase/integrase [Ectothiorhodospiraceae bacterium WFHF3C12]|nr:tyrosine-type recombinase/integrase [Ectothiorhodospiraceae bacterium WFHF3C12]